MLHDICKFQNTLSDGCVMSNHEAKPNKLETNINLILCVNKANVFISLTFPAFEKNSYTSLSVAFSGI